MEQWREYICKVRSVSELMCPVLLLVEYSLSSSFDHKAVLVEPM